MGALFCGLFGPLVHILAVIQFATYFAVVFMPVYMLMMVIIFITVINGKTILPKWSAFLNPAIIMVVVN